MLMATGYWYGISLKAIDWGAAGFYWRTDKQGVGFVLVL